ncbi:MAG: hypothetical protein ACRD3Q_08065 [Terriglobales bacterium]
MDKEQALQQIRHHEAAAARHGPGAKAEQHFKAIRILREQHGMAEPNPLVSEITSANRDAAWKEAERIKHWKETR